MNTLESMTYGVYLICTDYSKPELIIPEDEYDHQDSELA